MTRIISGVAGSLRIEVPKAGTRPTSDRVREAIFSTLQSWGLPEGAAVLDLYAGSGALALEAVSRGAVLATLVERHQQAAQVAQRNATTVLSACSGELPTITVERQAVQAFLLSQQDRGTSWDIVFIDPPYDIGETELAATLAALVPLLNAEAAVMVERSSRSPEPTWPDGLSPLRERRYGETVLWWAEPTPAEDA